MAQPRETGILHVHFTRAQYSPVYKHLSQVHQRIRVGSRLPLNRVAFDCSASKVLARNASMFLDKNHSHIKPSEASHGEQKQCDTKILCRHSCCKASTKDAFPQSGAIEVLAGATAVSLSRNLADTSFRFVGDQRPKLKNLTTQTRCCAKYE